MRLKKMIIVTACIGLIISLSGCSSNKTKDEVTQNKDTSSNSSISQELNIQEIEPSELPITKEEENQVTVTPEEKAVNSFYTIDADDEDTLAAMFYLGYGDTEKENNLEVLLQTYGLLEDEFETVIAVEDCEWYMILPKYTDTQIVVEKVELDAEGELVSIGELCKTTRPILLCCNYSDIVPSTKVTITYKEESIEFNPFISLENGEIAKVDRVFTK